MSPYIAFTLPAEAGNTEARAATNAELERANRGRSAADIYRHFEGTPHWMVLWRRSASKLPRTGRRILAALMVDWRSRPAARIAGVDHKTVDAWKTIFKVHFAQCFRAYKRDFPDW